MAFIQPDLRRQSQQNPQSVYPVLITLKGAALPPELADKGKFVFTNKIFAAKISGQEIQSFAGNEEIDAIEPDTEMNTIL